MMSSDQDKPKMQVLSATKQRRSLGATKKREKSTRNFVRTTVVVPSDVDWPDVNEEAEKKILAAVEKTMKCLDIPKRHCPLKLIAAVPKEERPEFRRKWLAENALRTGYDISNYIAKRTEICIGVNCCSMNMECTNHLVGLIIEKNVEPQIITKLLVPIARANEVPIVSVTGLSDSFKKACGIKCIALGFKVACESLGSDFYSLLALVKEHSPCDKNHRYKEKTKEIKLKCSEDTAPMIEILPHTKTLTSTFGLHDSQSSLKPLTTEFSIHDEIKKFEKKTELLKKKQEFQGNAYVSPKIRKMTPKSGT